MVDIATLDTMQSTGKHKLVKHLSQPWFDLVASGRKTVEGRLYLPYYAELQPGDRILFHNGDGGSRHDVLVDVESTKKYDSFAELLDGEGLAAVLPLPEVQTVDQGVAVYRQFYSEADECQAGVIAIRVAVLVQ